MKTRIWAKILASGHSKNGGNWGEIYFSNPSHWSQRETIRHLFNHHDWDFQEVPTKESADQSNLSNNDQEIWRIYHWSKSGSRGVSALSKSPLYFLWDKQTNVVNWETPSNTHRRKDKYKRFWTMLFHRNVWADPRYKERKRRVLQDDPHRRNHVYHRRDIMPKCVFYLVIHWLPNLKDQPYIGHMWE